MQASALILGKNVQVVWSKAADQALRAMASPLSVEMELYFSCLIRKAVRFGEGASGRYSVLVTPQLNLSFRPVVTRSCKVSDIADDKEPPLDDFQLSKPEAFVPKKLVIDFKRGCWEGEFYL